MDRTKFILAALIVAGIAIAGTGAWLAFTAQGESVGLRTPSSVSLPEVVPGSANVAPPPPSPVSSPTVEEFTTPPAAVTCTNGKVGYTVTPPLGWTDRSQGNRKACRFFDDDPVGPEQASMAITRINAAYADWVTSYEGDHIEVISRTDTTLSGHIAVAIHFRFVDSPEAEVYDYLVELDGIALILEANSTYAEDFPEAMRALDALAASLELTP